MSDEDLTGLEAKRKGCGRRCALELNFESKVQIATTRYLPVILC